VGKIYVFSFGLDNGGKELIDDLDGSNAQEARDKHFEVECLSSVTGPGSISSVGDGPAGPHYEELLERAVLGFGSNE